MMVYWASVLLMAGILVTGGALTLFSLSEDEELGAINAFLLICAILMAVALGVRIGEGVF